MRLFFDTIFTAEEMATLGEIELIALENERLGEQMDYIDALREAHLAINPDSEAPMYMVISDEAGCEAVQEKIVSGYTVEQTIIQPRGTDLYAYFNAL
jgi:hypothetical protein